MDAGVTETGTVPLEHFAGTAEWTWRGAGLAAPGFKTLRGYGNLGLKRLVRQSLELLQDLAGGGIGALIFGGLNNLYVRVFCPF